METQGILKTLKTKSRTVRAFIGKFDRIAITASSRKSF